MLDRTGQKIRLILTGNRFYSGTIVFEDEFFLKILDKFGEEVVIGKTAVISLENVKNVN